MFKINGERFSEGFVHLINQSIHYEAISCLIYATLVSVLAVMTPGCTGGAIGSTLLFWQENNTIVRAMYKSMRSFICENFKQFNDKSFNFFLYNLL